MKTVQMTLDEKLLKSVDKMIKSIKTKALEKKHLVGYSQFPVQSDEFNDWKDEQKWVD